jgi:hypothetical protein
MTKQATIVAGGAAGAGLGAVATIDPQIVIAQVPTVLDFLKEADVRVALVVIALIVVVGGRIWWRESRRG